jgi:hypothetical protein
MTGIFGILESSATQWYRDVAPTQEFFFIVTSIVYGMRCHRRKWSSLISTCTLPYRAHPCSLNSPHSIFFFICSSVVYGTRWQLASRWDPNLTQVPSRRPHARALSLVPIIAHSRALSILQVPSFERPYAGNSQRGHYCTSCPENNTRKQHGRMVILITHPFWMSWGVLDTEAMLSCCQKFERAPVISVLLHFWICQ